MQILVIDRKLSRIGWEEKEGEVLKESFLRLGHECIIAGKGYENDERSIPDLSRDCDFCLITENYWQDWAWWNLGTISIPKYIWAIDLDPQNFGNHLSNLIREIDFAGIFVIDRKIGEYMEYSTGKSHHYLPYAIFNESREVMVDKQDTDILFIGSKYPQRIEIFPKETVFKNDLFGPAYYEAISRARINLNWSLTEAINGKVFEIISAKGFLLSNRTKESVDLFGGYLDLYDSKDDLYRKVSDLLHDEKYRNSRKNALYSYCAQHHRYINRAEEIIRVVKGEK